MQSQKYCLGKHNHKWFHGKHSTLRLRTLSKNCKMHHCHSHCHSHAILVLETVICANWDAWMQFNMLYNVSIWMWTITSTVLWEITCTIAFVPGVLLWKQIIILWMQHPQVLWSCRRHLYPSSCMTMKLFISTISNQLASEAAWLGSWCHESLPCRPHNWLKRRIFSLHKFYCSVHYAAEINFVGQRHAVNS